MAKLHIFFIFAKKIFTMQYGFVFLSVVPVRKESSSRSEQVTQLLFGDVVRIVDTYKGTNKITDSWLKIENVSDNYQGWIDERNIILFDAETLPQYKYIVSSIFAKISIKNKLNPQIEKTINIVMASKLFDKVFTLNDWEIKITEGNVIPTLKCSPLLISAVSMLYLSTPYQWGGKSVVGMDCSGFTQNVFAFAGVSLSRDASQQALQGRENSYDNIQKNDLVFFDNQEGKITHVGIYLGDNQVIHCSGRVRIDKLDKEGIYIEKDSNKEYSHHLCLIRSIV